VSNDLDKLYVWVRVKEARILRKKIEDLKKGDDPDKEWKIQMLRKRLLKILRELLYSKPKG